MNIASHKKTILILIAVLVVFFGYWFFFLSKKDAQESLGQNTNQNLVAQNVTSSTPYDKEFVSSLLGLNSVNLDVSIFQSKVYQALSYPEVPFIVNYLRDSGRDNPFLPIGVDINPTPNVQNQNKATTTTAATVTATPPPETPTTPVTPPVNPVLKKF